MATLRDVAAFAAKAVAAQAGMSLLGMNPGKKRKKDDTTKKALVIGTGLAMLKGAASAGAGMATKALATKAGMAMLGLNPIFKNPRIKWVPFGRGYLYAVESFGGKYASWHWAVRRTNSIHGHAASGGLGHDSRAEAVAAAKDHIAREMAREKHRKMWERKHGPTFGRNPLLMVVPNKGRKGDPLVLKTANEGHGFFGETAGQYGQAVAEYAWDVVFKELLKGGWKPYTVRLFLDARWGRHLADQVYIQGIPDKAKIRTAVLKALKSEARWIATTMPEMDAERKLGGVRWNPGKKISGNMISINLHRGGYPTLIHESAKWAIRKRDRGVWSPSDYKNALLREWHNLGQGGGYSSGFTFQKKDPETGVVVELVETFNSPLAVFILTRKEAGANPGRRAYVHVISAGDGSWAVEFNFNAARPAPGKSSPGSQRLYEATYAKAVQRAGAWRNKLAASLGENVKVKVWDAENPGRTLVHGGKGRDSVVLGWKSKAEAKAYVAKKNRDGYIASVHPGRAGAPPAARWVTISSRHKMFFKGPWGKNPGARWHKKEYEDALLGQEEAYPEQKKYWEGVAGAHLDSYNKAKKIGPYASKNPGGGVARVHPSLPPSPTERELRAIAASGKERAVHGRMITPVLARTALRLRKAASNPSYLLTPRVRQLRTIATSGVPGRVGDLLVDGLKVDPVTARAVLKFLAAQTHNWADTLAKEPIGRLIQYAYKNAKRR